MTNHSQHRASGCYEDAPGAPEGGVRCQVLDFSASDEEVERSSTGSLSRGAVPKEAPGSLASRTFILVLRSFSLPLSPSLSLSLSLSPPLFLADFRSFSLGRVFALDSPSVSTGARQEDPYYRVNCLTSPSPRQFS